MPDCAFSWKSAGDKSSPFVFDLFVDLVRAFDHVLRELVFGVPLGVTDVSKHLWDPGLTETQMDFETSFIARHGSLFGVMGSIRVSSSWCAICTLHQWVTYGSLESAIIVRIGGRQECVFGSSGVPHAVRSGPRGAERRAVEQRNRHAYTHRLQLCQVRKRLDKLLDEATLSL